MVGAGWDVRFKLSDPAREELLYVLDPDFGMKHHDVPVSVGRPGGRINSRLVRLALACKLPSECVERRQTEIVLRLDEKQRCGRSINRLNQGRLERWVVPGHASRRETYSRPERSGPTNGQHRHDSAKRQTHKTDPLRFNSAASRKPFTCGENVIAFLTQRVDQLAPSSFLPHRFSHEGLPSRPRTTVVAAPYWEENTVAYRRQRLSYIGKTSGKAITSMVQNEPRASSSPLALEEEASQFTTATAVMNSPFRERR
jgi:hypothetical protein